MTALGAEGLLERELEAAHLQRAVDHSWHGVGRLVVIEGPAGIGKTTLLGSARELAREAGMNVLGARGAELEQSFAFGVVRQLFDALMAAATESERDEWLSGAAQHAAPLFDPRVAMDEPRGQDSIYPRLHGLYWLCSNLASGRPLALLIDDAQWADEPSLAFLGFLARRLEELPILLVAAVRSASADAPEALTALIADPAARVLKPRGLSATAVEQTLAAQLGSGVEEGFALACHQASAGNPFLLRELIHELDETGIAPLAANVPEIGSLAPQRVADAVMGRLGRVSPAAPMLARAVAILGDGASLLSAAALAGLEDQTAIDAAAAMRIADLVGDQAGLTFAHPIIRTAIYQSVLPAERVIHHAQAARLLHQHNAPAEQIAAQILLAGDLSEPWMLEQLQSAASAAMALGAPRNAVAYLRRALDVEHERGERARLLAALGQAEALGGLRGATEHLREAVELTPDPEARARVAIALAELLRFTGSAPRGVQLLSELDPVADQRLNDRVAIELLSTALVSHRAHELLAERIGGLEDRGVPASTERERFELVLLAFETLLANRPVAQILELITRAGLDRGSIADRIMRPPQASLAVIALTYCDQFDAATAGVNRLIDGARRRGSLGALVIGLSMREEIALRRGDLTEALADATEAFELSRLIAAASPLLLQHPIATTNNIAVEQQSTDRELQQLLARTDESVDQDTLHRGHTLISRARLLLALGQTKPALDQLLAVGRLPRAYGVATPAFLPWRSQAALLLYQLGDPLAAQRLANEEVELARAMGAPRALGIALRANALVHTPPAVEALQEALDILERSPARLEHARTLVDLGATRRRAGERAASRAPLREGHDLALLCSATLLAERARAEIAATGARVAPIGLRGVASLTPSERRVAELAAQGQTNKHIGQTLFITESTVETHLRHAYDKLDVRSRHKLSALLPQSDATPA